MIALDSCTTSGAPVISVVFYVYSIGKLVLDDENMAEP